MCIGPVGLAETYSTLTVCPPPIVRAAVVARRRRGSRAAPPPRPARSRRMLMKPGPAISALVDLVERRRASATIGSASARGLVPARLASTIAALVARSPCAGSRGGSTATAPRSTPGRQRALGLEGVEHGVEMRGKAGVERHGHVPERREGAALDEGGADLNGSGADQALDRAPSADVREQRPRRPRRIEPVMLRRPRWRSACRGRASA